MRQFGLIGYPLSHSFSKRFFTEKFAGEGISDASYENYSLASIDQFPALLASVSNIAGLNVTIPYKEAILPFLDESDEVVNKIGACNCIKIVDGMLKGFNTDVYGFGKSLRSKLLPHHQNALVLGSGGASKAVCHVLSSLNIPYLIVSRTAKNGVFYEDLNPEIYRSHTLIINTTPLGTYPAVDGIPPLDYSLITEKHFLFDLVYNPEVTAFLQKGIDAGAITLNGYDMLVYQAERSWEIWNEG